MSSNYSAWDTAENSGASLEGTMTADRASGPSIADMIGPGGAAPPPPRGGIPGGLMTMADQIERSLGGLGEYQARKMAEQEPEVPNFQSLTRKADGTTDIKGVSSKFLEDVMGQLTDLNTMKSAAMARVAQLKQQEASGSPILDALSQFAGNMAANDPTMPGWVRAMGATNLQMGPQGIKRERMAEEQKAIGLSGDIASMSLSAAKLQDEQQQRQFAEAQRTAALAASTEKAKLDATFKAHDDAYNMITQSGEFDASATAKKMLALGIPQEQIIAEIEDLSSYADARKAFLQAKEDKADAKELARLKAIADVAGARVDASERKAESTERLKTEAAEQRFKLKVLAESKPTAVVSGILRDSTQAYESMQNMKQLLADNEKKFGYGTALKYTVKAWRSSEGQAMLSASLDSLTEMAKAAGLKPLSDTDLRIIKQGIFDPQKGKAANEEVLRNMERKLNNLFAQIIEANPGVDWTALEKSLPEPARVHVPEARERRRGYFAPYMPDSMSDVPTYAGPRPTPGVPDDVSDLAANKMRRSADGNYYANIPGKGITKVAPPKGGK